MKSKTFCSKFMKTSFIKQLWVMGLMAFAYFMIMPVPLAVMINNAEEELYRQQRLQQSFMEFLLQGDTAYVFLVLTAVFVAFIQFSYLHSGRQMDFYGSLPIKKVTLFSQRVVFAYVDFAVPYTIMLIVCLIVGAVRQLVTGTLLIYVLEMWLVNQIGFMLILLITALAIVMTGRKWVGFLGCVVFLAAGYVIPLLFEGLASVFFDTYYLADYINFGLFFSPVGLVYQMRDAIFSLEMDKVLISAAFILQILIVAVVTVLIFLLNRYLIRIRQSEKAGQSMAFSIPARVIHVGLSIFMGLYIGMITMSFVYVNETLWFFMGAVFGTACIYVLVQFIYTLDIRRTFTYKWQILGAELVVLLICSIYSFDLLGYDAYLPQQDDLESVAIHYDHDNAYNDYYRDGIRISGEAYAMDTMALEPDDMTYALLEETVENQDAYRNREDLDEEYRLEWIYVRYRLENGREKERMYLLPIVEYKETFVHFYDQEDYRDILIPAALAEGEMYSNISLYYAGEEGQIFDKEDSAQKMQEFMEVYQRDIKLLDSAVFVEDIPVAKLYVSIRCGNTVVRRELPVYAECKETMNLLKEMGHTPIAAMSPEAVLKIEVEHYDFDSEDIAAEAKVTEGAMVTEIAAEEMKTYTFTKKEEIAQILKSMIDERYTTLFHQLESDYHIRVYMKDSSYEICCYGNFLKGQVPDVVLEQ